MRTSSLDAIAGLTHAYSSSIAAPVFYRAAKPMPSIFGHEGMRSYLRHGRPTISRLTGRAASRTTGPTNPHPRDIQESIR